MSQSHAKADVAVIGAGPSGLAVAVEAAARGLEVVVVAPEPEAPWRQRYGLWQGEIDAADERACAEAVFPAPYVMLDDVRRVALDWTYLTLSTPALQERLRARCSARGVRWRRGGVGAVEPFGHGTWLRLDDGGRLRATIVVDASGAGSKLVRRVDARMPAFQAAYGALVEVDRHDYAPGEMALMDYRGDDEREPTFLYALPLDDRRLFVEETSLVRRPALGFELLRRRLARRVARNGLRIRRIIDREHCFIPMGLPLPARNQTIVAFGAAAAMVHPANGYQIARALRLAAPLAEAIASGLSDSPRRAAKRAYEVIWPRAQLRAWELYTFGMEFLADLDLHETRSFLAAFFRLPRATWLRFMQANLTPTEIVVAMAQVFGFAPPLRSKLVSLSAGRGQTALLRSALPNNPS